MSKPEWGKKYVCQSCKAKYYDLHKKEVICPSCNALYDPDWYLKNRRVKSVIEHLDHEIHEDKHEIHIDIDEDLEDKSEDKIT